MLDFGTVDQSNYKHGLHHAQELPDRYVHSREWKLDIHKYNTWSNSHATQMSPYIRNGAKTISMSLENLRNSLALGEDKHSCQVTVLGIKRWTKLELLVKRSNTNHQICVWSDSQAASKVLQRPRLWTGIENNASTG